MKKIFVLVALCIACTSVRAQEYQANMQLNQLFLLPHTLNPAFSGIEKYWQVQLGARYMQDDYWDQGQVYISLNGSLYEPDIRQNSIRISNPNAYEEEETDKAYRDRMRRHGFGAYLGSDEFGFIHNITGMLSYAYHIPLSRNLNMSAGLGLAFNNFSLAGNAYFVRNESDDLYQAFTNGMYRGELAKTHLDVNAGLNIYNDKFYAGASVQQLMIANWKSEDAFTDKVSYNDYNLQLGYQLPLTLDLRLQPSLVARYDKVNSARVYGNVKVNYRDVIWAGGGYRNGESFSAMLGLRAFNKVSISYAWDNPTSAIDFQNRGGHEISIGISLRNRENHSPYFW